MGELSRISPTPTQTRTS